MVSGKVRRSDGGIEVVNEEALCKWVLDASNDFVIGYQEKQNTENFILEDTILYWNEGDDCVKLSDVEKTL